MNEDLQPIPGNPALGICLRVQETVRRAVEDPVPPGAGTADAQAREVLDEKPTRQLKKIPRSNLRAMTAMFLKQQGGLCPLCRKPIDLTIAREGVVDHDHNTGEVRGVLHRGCNGAEGKVANSVGRWAGTGMQYDKIIPWLENLLAYLKQEGTGWMYPTHQTAEEKALKAKLKRRTTTAQKQARIKVRSMKPKEAP